MDTPFKGGDVERQATSGRNPIYSNREMVPAASLGAAWNARSAQAIVTRVDLKASLDEKGYWFSTEDCTGTLKTLLDMKLYVIPYISTFERLADHFFRRLRMPVQQQSNGIGQLTNLRFWETPNCYSDYPGLVCNKD
jgi:hypothetical protein